MLENTSIIEAALFPIPNSVNFPGIPCPLHVFEPRYRKMIQHCLDKQLLLGVCHTEKVLHAPDTPQNMEQALHSNQATYKPCDIFSAGPVILLEELEDGRLVIEVGINIRLRLQQEIQTLPFNIWACEECPDQPLTEHARLMLEQTQQKILQRLIVMTHTSPQYQNELKGDYWQKMPSDEFSFAVMGMLGMEAGIKQQLLEMTDPTCRLEQVLNLLNQFS